MAKETQRRFEGLVWLKSSNKWKTAAAAVCMRMRRLLSSPLSHEGQAHIYIYIYMNIYIYIYMQSEWLSLVSPSDVRWG